MLINSVGSGIGSAAVQLAKLAGAFVIGNASARTRSSTEAKELGLDVGINHTTQDVVAEVMRVTDGMGVDVVYEHVGGELFQEGLDSLAKDGRLVICGAHSGEVVPFDIIPFFRGQKQIIGSFVFDRDEVETCFDLVAHAGSRRSSRDLPARGGARGDGADGAPRALRQDRPHAGGRMKRLGVDVGGTFTDLIYVDDEAGRSSSTSCRRHPTTRRRGRCRGSRSWPSRRA